jgi:hypothetical protein
MSRFTNVAAAKRPTDNEAPRLSEQRRCGAIVPLHKKILLDYGEMIAFV